MSEELTTSMRETIRSAAQKLTGARRRQFQAEVAERYCEGSPRRAEEVFGWGREAVNKGLHEQRSGMSCVDNFSARGRRKTEEKYPEMAQRIEALVAPESQADPKFQTPLAFTRMTAQAADHDMDPAAVLAPAGILEVLQDQLHIVFGTSPDTSDFVADALSKWSLVIQPQPS